MTKKTTKRALLLSILSMMLCVAMLVGSTFAWFTDSVTSGMNKIVAGNLDVELYHSNGKVKNEEVGEDTKLFVSAEDENFQWEPGAMLYENFTVKNAGSLALKYKLMLNAECNSVDGRSLENVLKVAVLNETFSGDRAEAMKANFDKTVAEFVSSGAVLASGELLNKDDTKDCAVIIYWEPSENDNDYNFNNGKEEELYIELGVNLVATQVASESDSFDKDYDENAIYGKPWNGTTVDTAWYSAEATSFKLSKPEELAGLAALVNEGTTFEGKTIALTEDVSLGDKEWTPIGNIDKPFKGTFEGGRHTVSGIAINANWNTEAVGFFGYVENAEISGLKVDGLVVINQPAEPKWDAIACVGGICGVASNTVIERCTNSIDFDASNVTISDLKHAMVVFSGICGVGTNININNGSNNQTYIRNCLNEGNFILATNGGDCPITSGITMLIGENKEDSRLIAAENCVNVGHITVKNRKTGKDVTDKCGDYLGGMAWLSDGAMKNCHSANIVPVADFEGDFVNEITSAEDMAKQSTFVGFDFENVWELTNGQYPTLRK